jgi:type II secretory pathway pseudopilin PulG
LFKRAWKRVWNLLAVQRGWTLLEILLVLAMLLFIVSAIVNLLVFSSQSFKIVDSEAIVRQEAQLFLMQIERDVRSAHRGSDGSPAIRVLDDGRGLMLNTLGHGEERLIQYSLQDDALMRGVLIPGEATLWSLQVSNVIPFDHEPLFSISGNQVKLKFNIGAGHGRLSRNIEIDMVLTVRSKEVM